MAPKRAGFLAISLIAAFALSAIAASSAFAGEYGECVKVKKGEVGKFTDKNCTILGEGKARYVWKEVDLKDKKFTDKTKAVTFTVRAPEGETVVITCKKSTSTGEITGYLTDTDVFTFSGCAIVVKGSKKTIPCGEGGIIKTNRLESILIDHETKGLGGLEPKEGETWVELISSENDPYLAEFSCAGVTYRISGSISGVYEPVNQSGTKGTVSFGLGKGEQDLITEVQHVAGGEFERQAETVATFTEQIKYSSKVEVRACNEIQAGPTAPRCEHIVPQGACAPSSSLNVFIEGPNVIGYVPKGNWGSSTTGVAVMNVQGSSITNTLVPTSTAVNSCAVNTATGEVVCTSNNTEVYVLKGTGITKTLTSGATGTISFSGGSCVNCGVAMDPLNNRALIGMSVGGKGGFQFLHIGSGAFEAPFASASGRISEDPLVDPVRNLVLSATEANDYEIVNVTNPASPAFYENSGIPSGGVLDSSGEDCSTGIALAPVEGAEPSHVFISDLTQATFTPGSPGTWSGPSQVQTLSESSLSAGASGIAIAQGTHTGFLSGEFGGNQMTAISLPPTSGSGTPALPDWVSCSIGAGFSNGFDPHTVTAYQDPTSGDAIGLLANGGASELARVDLTKMLNPSDVPRTGGGHACASGTLPAGVVSSLTVP